MTKREKFRKDMVKTELIERRFQNLKDTIFQRFLSGENLQTIELLHTAFHAGFRDGENYQLHRKAYNK